MASGNLPLDEAQLFALFMGSILYGIFLVSFVACIQVLWFDDRSKGKVNVPMLIAAISMAVVATVSIAFQVRHVLEAFIWYHGPGGPNAEFENISYWVNVMQTICYYVQTFIGDLILIYRCFVVYNRRWFVVSLPLIVWVATLACGVITIHRMFDLHISTNMNDRELLPVITSALVLTMIQTMITTTLIAHRIWTMDRNVFRYRASSPVPVIRMIIESGAVYTLSVAVFLIVYLCRNNAQYPVAVCIEQIIGIVFNMIIVRVHQSHNAGQAAGMTDHATSLAFSEHAAFPSEQSLGSPKKSQWRPTPDAYAMQPVQVTVTRQVVQDTDNSEVWESKGTTDDLPSAV